MDITLTGEAEKFINDQMKSGHYSSATDVIADGLRMLRSQEVFIQENLDSLRKEIALGMEDIRAGKVVDGKKAIQDIRKKLRERMRGKQ